MKTLERVAHLQFKREVVCLPIEIDELGRNAQPGPLCEDDTPSHFKSAAVKPSIWHVIRSVRKVAVL
jgi:hypothetical protein